LLEEALSPPVRALFYGLRGTGDEGIIPRVSLVHSGAIVVGYGMSLAWDDASFQVSELSMWGATSTNSNNVRLLVRCGDRGGKSRASLITPLRSRDIQTGQLPLLCV
jgi:hypothetical protein